MQPKERTLVYLTEKDKLIQDLDKVIYKRWKEILPLNKGLAN